LRRVAGERRGSETTCLICAIDRGAFGRRWAIAEGRHASLLLTAYPVRWGHLLVVLREHVTSFSELEPAAWREASELGSIEFGKTEDASV
jgi:diadenosine tetraphosphate (Ap4A) HIT family hydrolase